MKPAVRRASAIATLLATTLVLAPTAHAKPDRLEVSTDGSTWRPDLNEPLFKDLPLLVPDDNHDAVFFVRNASKRPARATVRVLDSSRTSELASYLRVTAAIGDVTTGSSLLDTAEGCSTTITGPTLMPGTSQRVDLGVEFVDVTEQTAQGADAGLDVEVTLRQVGPKGTVSVCGAEAEAEVLGVEDQCDDNRATVRILGDTRQATDCVVTGTMPDTGAPGYAQRLTIAGLAALATGFWLLIRRRRQERR